MGENYSPELSPFSTGVAGKCPGCGRGKLFAGYLTVAHACKNCGLSFAFADSGDGAAWFVMLFVCVVGVGSIVGVEIAYSPPFTPSVREVDYRQARAERTGPWLDWSPIPGSN